MKNVTRLGRFCRKLRVDNNELLYDMAHRIGVSSAFLSQVENGKKKPPKDMLRKLVENYKLSQEQIKELETSVFEASNQESIDISDYDESEKELMLSFARSLKSFNKREIEKIKELIKE